MKKRLMFLALAAVGLASCNGGFKKLDAGMEYKIADDKSGPSIKEGDYIFFNFTVKNDADSVMQTSTGRSMPQMTAMPKDSLLKGNIMEVFSYLSEGDSVVIRQDIDSVMKGRQRPPYLKGKKIAYEVRIEKVIAKGNLSDEVFRGRVKAYVQKIEDAAKSAEPVAIKKYIADKKLKVTTTSSGLNYIITKQGEGPTPAPGDTVEVNYAGTFLNGKGFDTNIKSEAARLKLPINPMSPYKPIRFVPNTPGMIQGWSEAFMLFNKGTKATLIIPSSLAYGEQGDQIIGPFTPLVFDVELVDIIPAKPGSAQPAKSPVVKPAK
ncbi:MAG TPA: FKBP-type peptidyl-prolyl cis-trans isomerase [Mucilaginibacter sp.]|nr:FKBP-type peptidyl-prolyl cis-trans isomerase [Mucilaginibacter sp.]